MSTIEVQWTASNELVQKEYVETGNRPKAAREFELDLTALTPEQRKPIIEADFYQLNVSKVYTFKPDRYLNNTHYLDCAVKKFDHEPLIDEVVAYCQDYLAEGAKGLAYEVEVKAAEKAEKERIAALEAEWRPQLDALIEAKDLDGLNVFDAPPELTAVNYAANKAWRELRAERLAWDKEIWIKYHASALLKRAFAAGYDCQREYVLQRAAFEAPDACDDLQVDFNNTADWKDRSCPSEEALDIAAVMRARFGSAKVVWLTAASSSNIPCGDDYDDYDEPEYFVPCEAVVSTKFLDKYTLVQIV